MENNKDKNGTLVCHGCACWDSGMGGGHRWSLLRIVIGVFIAFVIFAIGMKVGEFKSRFMDGRFGHGGYRMMGQPYYYGYPQPALGGGATGGAPVPGMMRPQGYNGGGTTSTTTPNIY